MSLATRCPSCGTVFRVVQDQLRVSEGWVRCGRCGEAFNALEAIVTWPPPHSAVAPEPVSEPVSEPAFDTPDVAFVTSDGAMAPQAAEELRADAEATAIEQAVLGGEPAPEPPPDAPAESLDAAAGQDEQAAPGIEPAASAKTLQAAATSASEATASRDEGAASSDPPAPPKAPAAGIRTTRGSTASPAPSFVQQADRAARWQRPWVRAGLVLMLLLATLGLAGQVAYAFRDRIAASLPTARPLLLQACATLGCRIDDYRQIDALTVQSSGLSRMEGAALYRLALTLHNRAAHDVAAPAVDLVVSDAQGRQIARRVLTMGDLGLPLRTLRPGREMPITAPLAVDGEVSGYTVEIFYP
jgi:predicted Zn finger-like uncharacterized protein